MYNRFRNIWHKLKQRSYKGQRIGVCQRWKDFELFKKDMHKKYLEHVQEHGVKDTTIDRIDNRRGYYPENCRWATYKEQGNNRANNLIVSFKGKKNTLSQWVKELDLPPDRTYYRINKGWSPEEAFTLGNWPVEKRNKSCVNGHIFDEENTRWYRGHRYCRACRRKHGR